MFMDRTQCRPGKSRCFEPSTVGLLYEQVQCRPRRRKLMFIIYCIKVRVPYGTPTGAFYCCIITGLRDILLLYNNALEQRWQKPDPDFHTSRVDGRAFDGPC